MARSIHESIEIAATPEQVFAAWTEPDQLLAWWGAEGSYRSTHWECDLRVGGKWVSRGRSTDGKEFRVEGEYLCVEPPKLLSFTWNPSWGDDGRSIVELRIEPIATGTRLTLSHTGFATDEARDVHARGWPGVFAWFKTYAEARGGGR